MKKIYFLAFALVGFLSVNAQVIIEDDFESYPLGSYFGGHWSNWTGSSSNENIIISSDQANSGTKSGYISDDGIQDAVLQFGSEYVEGIITMKFMLYLPSDGGAYINIQELTNIGTGNFANVLTFNYSPTDPAVINPGKGYLVGTDFYYPFDIPTDEWFEMKLVVDMDNLSVLPTVNGSLMNDGSAVDYGPIPYSGELYSVAALDFYSNLNQGAISKFYVDDVKITVGSDAAVDDFSDRNISVYPTLVSSSFTISSKSAISQVSVLNLEGKQVMSVKPNKNLVQVNTSSLPAGVYVVKTVSGKETKSTKIIVK